MWTWLTFASGVTSLLLIPGLRYLGVGEYMDGHSYIMYEAHLHAKHAKSRRSRGMPPEYFENLDSLRLNLKAFFEA